MTRSNQTQSHCHAERSEASAVVISNFRIGGDKSRSWSDERSDTPCSHLLDGFPDKPLMEMQSALRSAFLRRVVRALPFFRPSKGERMGTELWNEEMGTVVYRTISNFSQSMLQVGQRSDSGVSDV